MNYLTRLFDVMKEKGVHIIEKGSTKSAMSDGTPYALLKAKDVSDLFGISNSSEFWRSLCRREKEYNMIEMVKQTTGRPAMYIAEPLFYEFVLTSNIPQLASCQDWIFGTVIPEIIEINLD